MKKYIVFIFTLSYLHFFGNTVSAQTPLAQNLKCDVNIYKVFQNSSLPYSNNGTLIPSGTRTNSNSYYIYSLNLKNTLANPLRTTITGVSTTNISGKEEPITILDYKMYQPGSTCIKNFTENSLSCTSNFQFLNNTNGFMQVLTKVNSFSSDKYNTSTLFTINTDQGKVECATMLMLDASIPISDESPIKWATKFASLSANQLMIIIDNTKYFRGKEPVSIHSDGYDDGSPSTYTTLESTWYEDPYANNVNPPKTPVEMRLYMYFTRENNTWKLTETRTYNGNIQGDWFYYTPRNGEVVSSAVGKAYNSHLVFTETSGHNAQIICNSCSINAFMDLARETDPSYTITSPADSNITITNEPGTWFTIKVDVHPSAVLSIGNKIFVWDFNPQASLNLENLNPESSLIRINGSKVGSTKLRVMAYNNLNGHQDYLSSKDFVVTIVDSKTDTLPQCTYINQPIFQSKKSLCCDGLSLIPASDEQVGIVGYCVDKQDSTTQYDKLQAELSAVKSRLEASEAKQTTLQRMFSDLQATLNKILKLFRLK